MMKKKVSPLAKALHAAGNISYILGAALIIAALAFNLLPPELTQADWGAGAIWTTHEPCAVYAGAPQNVNTYAIGETVHIRGENFNPNYTYGWRITGQNGSADPGVIVADDTVTTDSTGYFCQSAYTIQPDDDGVYTVDVFDPVNPGQSKNDNYHVRGAIPSSTATGTATRTSTLPPTHTATSTSTLTPTNTPTNTSTHTPTSTSTSSPTATSTSTSTPTPTNTPLDTLTNTPTNTATITPEAATVTSSSTTVPPTSTMTFTPGPPTVTSTFTPRPPTNTPVTPTDPATLPPPTVNTPSVLIPVTGLWLDVESYMYDVQVVFINLGLTLIGLGLVLNGLARRFH
jgi:hypothetical protein